MARLNRRTFLKASTALFAAPTIIPSTCFGANERVTLGCIGVKGRGRAVMSDFGKAGSRIAAICDVDSDVLNRALSEKQKWEDYTPKGYDDYRRLLDQKDIDAVMIATPDHWHALMTIGACEAGKDVYCEKPLTLTIAEGRRMVQAARDNQKIVQTGSQQRSMEGFWKATTLVRNGALGTLQRILVGIPRTNAPKTMPPDSDPPANLNYDMWLGPAPWRPYNENRVHYNFRFWWDYSGGQITNFGAHNLDIAHWALDLDNGGPSEVEATATFNKDNLFEVTETCRVTYKYPNNVEVILGQLQQDIPNGVTFEGTKGSIFVTRTALKSTPEEIVQQDVSTLPIQLLKSTDHVQNFLDCVKSRELPICDVEIGHRTATVCHLGNIAIRLGRSLKWDPQTEQILNDPEAQRMTDRAYRAPWTHDGKPVS
ncbi:Gfo/Idh/MocA family protein [Planctomicrobium sp. SH664]|uniref:Gfo/Idh/MocA family protein n=1 Tax=Planctomicrobium sp. SH664 TaxID=3448125 RepID=UPI003F5C7788